MVFVCDVSVAQSLLTPDDKFYVLNIPKVIVGYCRMESAKEKGENTLTLGSRLPGYLSLWAAMLTGGSQANEKHHSQAPPHLHLRGNQVLKKSQEESWDCHALCAFRI